MLWKINAAIVRSKSQIYLVGRMVLSIKSMKNRQKIEGFLTAATEGISDDSLRQHLSCTVLHPLIARLLNSGLLISYNTEYISTPLERSHDFLCHYKGTADRPIQFKKNIHVTILGCGGIGANIALNLLFFGFRRFCLIDFDKVDASNLNRQHPYTNQDIGLKKVFALQQHLQARLQGVEVSCVDMKVTSRQTLMNALPQTDFIVAGIDSPPRIAVRHVVASARERGIPVLLGGAGYDSITIGPLLNQTKAMTLYIERRTESTFFADSSIKGSVPSTNGLLTSILSNEIINYFYELRENISLNKEIVMDPFTLTRKHEFLYEN